MKTVVSIGLMTVLSGAGVAAMAQQPTTPSVQPTQQTAPRVDPREPITQRADPAHENTAAKAAAPATPATPATPASAANAAKDAANQHMALRTMDTNKDGLVSRQEYMAHHDSMFAAMKKNSAGMIDLKDGG